MATNESLPFPTSTAGAATGSSGSTTSTATADRPGSYGGTVDRGMADLDGTTTGGESGRGELVDRVARTAHATIDRLADTAAPHVNRLSESLNHAGERVHDGAGQVRDVSAEWAEGLRTTVREHPLAALGAALAIGMLVAKLSR